MTKRASLLIVGATSGIGRPVAERFARDGFDLVLAGRDTDELERIAADLAIRHGVRTATERFEARDHDEHGPFWERCREKTRDIDGVIFCVGYLGEQERAEAEIDEVRRILDVNFTGCATFLTHVANAFEQRTAGATDGSEPAIRAPGEAPGRGSSKARASENDSSGQTPACWDDADGQSPARAEKNLDWSGPLPFICVVSSVAGDRGRASNYVYGSSKGGVDRFLQGMRQRLAGCGVPVVTVKPGPVDTAMTFGKEMPLTATPERVAGDIHRACRKGRNVVYTPWFWRPIMRILQHVPEPIFKRLSV